MTYDDIYTALAHFQNSFTAVSKTSKVAGKKPGETKYHFANLDTILEDIRPLLFEFELGFTQLVNGDHIITKLFHFPSGTSEQAVTILPMNVKAQFMNEFQADGSKFTYYKRYALSGILGLSFTEDDDANIQTNNQNNSSPQKKSSNDEHWISWANEQIKKYPLSQKLLVFIEDQFKNENVKSNKATALIQKLKNDLAPSFEQKEASDPNGDFQTQLKDNALAVNAFLIKNDYITPQESYANLSDAKLLEINKTFNGELIKFSVTTMQPKKLTPNQLRLKAKSKARENLSKMYDGNIPEKMLEDETKEILAKLTAENEKQ